MFSKSKFFKKLVSQKSWTIFGSLSSIPSSTRNFVSSDLRAKKLIFRAKNTGMKELDLILSDFIRHNPDVLESHHQEFESLLDMETCHIYDIVMGRTRHDLSLYRRICDFALKKVKPNN
ncbi:uncharacterized protein TA12770 [Theileria annulata]|uniref:Succinate dehydrogenase assembly factor 2, mitochondrial n=1 Tax=Theileria annulata TaxID=5874 RepID=Q4UE67_THEAN|nr:uncharacterized protein TA12770 [Theileria annulata]CAI74622.1 hypothetical protein TA12770 [Theileria annulata]|eukprot:XP_952354.1 hypothetical protein TA12770 [Theileria annulata]